MMSAITLATNSIFGALVEDCTFESDGAQGTAVKVASAFVTIRRCRFIGTAGTWATPVEYATSSDNCLMDDCVLSTTSTMTKGVSGAFANLADGVTIRNTDFGLGGGTSADAIRGFTAGECRVINCLIGSTANGTTSATFITRMNG
mgnify:FL=1